MRQLRLGDESFDEAFHFSHRESSPRLAGGDEIDTCTPEKSVRAQLKAQRQAHQGRHEVVRNGKRHAEPILPHAARCVEPGPHEPTKMVARAVEVKWRTP